MKARTVELVALVLLGAVVATATVAPFYYDSVARTQEAGNGPVFYVTAKQWEFAPNAFVVKQGQNVTFILTSIDVRHGFGIANYSVAIDADPGKYAKVSFVADKLGSFAIICFVYCGEPFLGSGEGHRLMRATLTVVPS